MQFTSRIIDQKIKGINISAELQIKEYLQFAIPILSRNEFQRKKVKSSGKIYDLLRKDIIQGCVIPPIILAVSESFSENLDLLVAEAIENVGFDKWDQIEGAIASAISKNKLIILGPVDKLPHP
ncbi:hypothetical protein [Parasphingorhabdus flavimaris]|uniref:hypothetical protein n=1 Tax=Parasphingorhabdus flavimaris TaxID=266812 RepID=UPI00300399FD